MSDGSDWSLDLIVRARRGELSPSEERRLKQCLRSSPALRVAHLVGSDFDRVGEVEPGDDQQVRRFVADALRHHTNAGRAWRGPRRLVTGLLAAAFLLSGTTAFGWWQGWVQLRFLAAPDVAPTSSAECQATPPVAPQSGTRPLPTTPSGEPSSQPELEAPAVALPHRAPVEPESSPAKNRTRAGFQASSRAGSTAAFAPVEASPPTAGDLFSSGNRARRAGQNARAIALFQQLQREFPSSAEAQLSRLSLGRVWLAQGVASQALAQFDGYLKSGGPLAEEALLGKARALAALGRFGEERAAWQTLQRRFPASVYHAQADERLRQLDGKAAR
jgi:TolA-binding protein